MAENTENVHALPSLKCVEMLQRPHPATLLSCAALLIAELRVYEGAEGFDKETHEALEIFDKLMSVWAKDALNRLTELPHG